VDGPQFTPLGESAWLVSFEPRLDLDLSDRVLACAAAVGRRLGDRVRDIVPAATSLAVHFDPEAIASAEVHRMLRDSVSGTEPSPRERRVIDIPVWYDEAVGPDLQSVAAFAGCSMAEVVQRHSTPRYRVLMLGFLPGFPYLGLVDERIAVPRLATPRLEVPAGSVAIAGRQTGVYPSTSPGGWRIIGRTPVRLFDPARPPYAHVRPGDDVQFVSVDRLQYDRLSRQGGTDAGTRR
jgi:inhibitor of KinA